ncbi:hypothetical protein [Actinomadura verrucosospora]|uniref:Aspartate carbamoyl transferase n=1 Tax=Actinomadura verrucosospora TaxID=46165 RepID=A0A7D3VW15_ACTVE|nr:hypothetical protein [Actinomadura verrucosospora]QKG24058.1 hypothetical protein ACTIVE_5701 [Actinomadura verrucosospora]
MNTREESIVSGGERTGTSADEPGEGALAVALRGLAAGRIVLGAAALVAPNAMAKASGVRPTPELGYMTRIFGARAIALGLGYLTASGRDRSRWQRLALLVDVIDTAHGAARLARGDLPRPTALGYTALTGAYMAVGATRLARDLA